MLTHTIAQMSEPVIIEPRQNWGRAGDFAHQIVSFQNAFTAFQAMGDETGMQDTFDAMAQIAWGLYVQLDPRAPLRAPVNPTDDLPVLGSVHCYTE
jgi:hypothetical protein